nr:uncharacterized protein LOC113822934 [Penaeus vannamei]
MLFKVGKADCNCVNSCTLMKTSIFIKYTDTSILYRYEFSHDKILLALQQGRGPEFYQQGALQGAMQDLSNLQQEIYPSMPHRIPVSPQMQQHHHPQQVVTPPRLHYHPALLSPPPEVLSRSSSDSSLHQNLVQGKTVNNRKGALASKAY